MLRGIGRHFLPPSVQSSALSGLKHCTLFTSSSHARPSDKTSNERIRTHRCGEVGTDLVGSTVKLAGWLEYKRGRKFFTLRDATGNCQILSDLDIQLPPKESVLLVEGFVQRRPENDVNHDMATGAVEIKCTKIETLNKCNHLPFTVQDDPKEEARMRYRYVDLRTDRMQRNLRLRSSFVLGMRKYLCQQHRFVDVETPTLFRRTPGGAREFLVPTENAGQFYCLPQSPQQFKQLLMVGGIDRYMQVAKCYRDEGAKPERQPEFTQLDLELSFTNQEEVKNIIEGMLVECWPQELSSPSTPFPRLTYHEAMTLYGSDKPDIRFGSTIVDVSEKMAMMSLFQTENSSVCVKAIRIPNGCNKLKTSDVKKIQDAVNSQYSSQLGVVKLGNGGVWSPPLSKHVGEDTQSSVNRKLDAHEGDLLFICAHQSWKVSCEVLGLTRQLASRYGEDNGHPLFTSDQPFQFLWVEDFPLFELEDSRLQSTHHPFTAPVDDDVQLMYSSPSEVRGQHYDLVLNGWEIGGGSIRIHDSRMQRHVLEQILREDTSQLDHLLVALDSGCPPHGGIALGLDRLLAIMCGAPTIRDVIAFPKSSKGADLMAGAPCAVNEDELANYHITVADSP